MGLSNLPAKVRRALQNCLSMERFDDRRFDQLLSRYGLAEHRATLIDQCYAVLVLCDTPGSRAARKWARS